MTEVVLTFGPFQLLPGQRVLLENGKPLQLGSRAFDVLLALVERAGEVVGKDELVARVWPDTFVDEGNLRVHIAALRKALADTSSGRRYIATVAGRGYCFVAPVSPSKPPGVAMPAPDAGDATRNLFASVTSVIGRADIVAAIGAELPTRRLVTIVGPGGIGKTTVAVAVANAVLTTYRDQARFVDLASLSDPRLLPSVLASALGLAVRSQDPLPSLVTFLRDKHILVVLDGCEHVINAAAALAEDVLKGAPQVHILATSREPLRAEGERIERLAPLGFPPASAVVTAEEAITFPAVQLFVERVSANLDSFEFSDTEAPTVAEICRRLDGIALAIELAAGRVETFGLRGLAARLDDRLGLLTRGRRTALPRHRTLSATLDWSYELLTADERTILRRLAVFAGSFTLESAAAVAACAEIPAAAVVDHIADLVAKSLVATHFGGAVAHYRLLDTTRAYALQKLNGSGELDDLTRRHAEHYRDLLGRAESELRRLGSAEWLAAYGHHIGDVRVALHWAFSQSGDAQLGVTLLLAAVPLWMHLLLLQECRERLDQALDRFEARAGENLRVRMQLLAALGAVRLQIEGLSPGMGAAWAGALAIAEKLEDTDYQLRAVWGLMANSMGESSRTALTYARRFCDVAARSSDPADTFVGDRLVGYVLHVMGDQAAAHQYIERMLANYVRPRDRSHLVRFGFDQRVLATSSLAQVLWLQGFPDQSLGLAARAVEDARSIDHTVSLFYALSRAACPVAISSGDLIAAQDFLTLLSEHASKYGPWGVWAHCFEAQMRLARADVAGSLALLGAARDRMAEATFAAQYPGFSATLAEALSLAGDYAEAIAVIDRVLTGAERREEHWYDAELLRIKGNIVIRQGAPDASAKAEAMLLRSLDIARTQTALSWELRAATSLAQLYREQARVADARALLSGVYRRFTEGLATADLKAARDILDELDKACGGPGWVP